MAEVKLGDFERGQLKQAYDYKCYICGGLYLPKELSIDHVIPPNKREEAILEGYIENSFDVDSFYNYAPICSPCNREKWHYLYPKNHCCHLLLTVRNKVPKVVETVNKFKEEIKTSTILSYLSKWEKSGSLENEKVYNHLAEFIHKRMNIGFKNGIILRPTENTKLEVVGQKSFPDNDIDNFIQKLKISQEMVFGYGNYGFIELEHQIYFYPVSFSRISRFLYRIPFYYDYDNRNFNIQTQIHAILLKDNKAVLISISKINLGLDIEEKYQFPNYTENQSLFDDIDHKKQYFQRTHTIMTRTIIRTIQNKIREFNNFSETVLQYILSLFGNGD
jgi:hypothetical protein